MAWAQQLSPRELVLGICPTFGAGGEVVLADGQAPVPESGTAQPLGLQLLYASVSAHSSGTADGLQGRRALVPEKASVDCSVKRGAGLGTVNAILIPCKNIEDMCGMWKSQNMNPACQLCL